MTYISDYEWDAFVEYCEDNDLNPMDGDARESYIEWVRDIQEDRFSSYRD